MRRRGGQDEGGRWGGREERRGAEETRAGEVERSVDALNTSTSVSLRAIIASPVFIMSRKAGRFLLVRLIHSPVVERVVRAWLRCSVHMREGTA